VVKSVIFVFSIICVLALAGVPAFAQGLSETLAPSESQVVQVDGGGVGYSSPAVAEIDGDTSNGMEMTVAGADGKLHVYHMDGTMAWSAELPNYACSGASSKDKVYSSPAVGAIMGDGVPYVVIGYGGFRGTCKGGVAAYDGRTGALAWDFNLTDFGREEGQFVFISAVFSTPALADVDGNGTLEIGFGGFDRNVFLLNADGSVRYYYHAADTVWSSPTFADANGDGKLEMFIGTDITENKQLKPATKNGGYIYALKTTLNTGERIEFRDPEKKVVLWSKYIPQVVFSAPVVADVLSTNPGAELIMGTGCYFPENTSNKVGKFIRVLSLSNGKVLRTLKTPTCTPATPAVGDLNNDGLLDVVISTPSDVASGATDGRGRLLAWTPETNTKMWEIRIPKLFPFQSALLADLDFDGSPEVVQATAAYIYFYSPLTGAKLGRVRPGGLTSSTPAIVDYDGDSRPDLVAATAQSGKGKFVIFPNITSPAADDRRISAGDSATLHAPWAAWRGGADRTGIAP
jgi:outer membrane protein assembly factor BamB